MIDQLMLLQSGGLVGAAQLLQEVISAMGPVLLMPLIIFAFGLLFGVKARKSFKLALLVGVGFIGIFAVLGYTLGPIGSTIQALSEAYGLNLRGVDVGWAPISGFTWALGVTVLMIPIGFAVNAIMLFAGLTRTFDADVWNFWHWAFNAGIVYVITESWVLAIAAGIIAEIITLLLADWTAELGQEYFGVPGTSLPHTESVAQAPFAFAIDKVLRRVPVIGSVEVNPESLEDRFGVFGEPIVIGFMVGLFIGVVSMEPPLVIFRTAMLVAALLTLLPRMVGLLIEGIQPIADQASDYFENSDWFNADEIHIGIDAGPIGLADTPSVVSGLLIAPYAVMLAFLPGVQIMPLGDLVGIPVFACMWAAAISNGNIVRTVINGALLTTIITYAASYLAPYMTEMGRISGSLSDVDTSAEFVTALAKGGHWWILGASSPLALPGSVGIRTVAFGLGTAALALACYFWTRNMPEEVAQTDSGTVETPDSAATPSDD
ncbi:PTS transporter subunit IIC [Haloarcula amylovorans]|uniref:PTS transporter subunit IIC n=1 Tax=Haloarcula amylovorans TaxID=2562280 RepID=UPI00107637BC|nr:PTS transporter subunit IIC [Halomicroarcula amylolytica]